MQRNPAKARAVWAPRENPDLESPTVASCDNQLGKQRNRSLHTEDADFVSGPVVLHKEPVPCLDVFVDIPGRAKISLGVE